MKIAFCLFNYFPYGGLQRDFVRIARLCQDRGHSVHVFTMRWEGEKPAGFAVETVHAPGFTNHRRSMVFSEKVSEYTKKDSFDVVVGFNKMKGLDVYYAADPCFQARAVSGGGQLYRLGSRYRIYRELEEAVFSPSSSTHILLISHAEREKFIRHYHTPEARFHTLPPGISRDRIPARDTETVRRNVRSELGVSDDTSLLLMVGSGFRTKGLDRSIRAIAGLPHTLRENARLYIIGHGKAGPFKRLAKRLKVSRHVYFLGVRDDVPRFLTGADILLHPAYSENTGTVLLEAMASGLPVLATDICGYAFHVRDAEAGLLIPAPFQQKTYNELLADMIKSPERQRWKENGPDYTSRTDIYSLPEKATDIIESVGKEKGKND